VASARARLDLEVWTGLRADPSAQQPRGRVHNPAPGPARSLHPRSSTRSGRSSAARSTPALNVLPATRPDRTFFRLVRTNAAPFPRIYVLERSTAGRRKLSTMLVFRLLVVVNISSYLYPIARS
jgi:hypothetical protein